MKPEIPETLRAIGLWQPWASAMALGLKLIETRHWETDYRGWVAICAVQTKAHSQYIYNAAVYPAFKAAGIVDHRALPFGAIVAVGYLFDCVRSETIRGFLSPLELALGNYEDERYGWQFRDVLKLDRPVPMKARQCWWSVTRKELGL